MKTRGSDDITEVDGAHQSSPPPNRLVSQTRKAVGSSKKRPASDDTSHEQVRRFKAWTQSPGSPPRKGVTPATDAGPLSPQRPLGVFPLLDTHIDNGGLTSSVRSQLCLIQILCHWATR